MSTLAINAKKWFEADWAQQKGLYAEIFDNTDEMDQAVNNLALEICNSSNKATKELKRIFWNGTEKWDQLLAERAEISGELILSEFSKKAINQLQNK